MNVPSFSSFPSFDSDSGPRNPPSTSPSSSKPEIGRHHRHKKDKDKRDKDKRDKKKDRSTDNRSIHDDERLKAEEDRKRTDEKPLYFSDRKGDNLNVRYGGLHAGDVPKYRLYASTSAVLLCTMCLTDFKAERRSLVSAMRGLLCIGVARALKLLLGAGLVAYVQSVSQL